MLDFSSGCEQNKSEEEERKIERGWKKMKLVCCAHGLLY